MIAPAASAAQPPKGQKASVKAAPKAAPAKGAASVAVTAPTETTARTIRAVAKLIQERHLVPRVLDEDGIRQWQANYIDDLDGNRVYFTQSEVDAYLAQQSAAASKVVNGDAAAAYAIFKKVAERMTQNLKLVETLLAKPLDLTTEEQFELKPAKFPNNTEEQQRRLRQNAKYFALSYIARGADEPAAREKALRTWRQRVRHIQQLKDAELLEFYLSALTRTYDPTSTYMAPKAIAAFENSVREQLEGIGAAINSDGDLRVVRVVPGGPAAKDGRLKAGDIIVGIARDDNGPLEDATQMQLSDAVERIRGKAGTAVRLRISRSGESEARTINIMRGKVQVDEVRGLVIEHGAKPDGTPFRIGVVHVPSLYASEYRQQNATVSKKSSTDLRKIIDDPQRGFKGAQVDLVILDMRNNQGGALKEAMALPGLFVDSGPMFQTRNRAGKVDPYLDPEKGQAWDGPLVMLTSRASGSGVEMVAAALQDYKRALIVGDSTTSGRGLVRGSIDVIDPQSPAGKPISLGAMLVVAEQIYRVSGESLQQRGVAADVTVSSLSDGLLLLDSDLPGSLPPDRVEPINHRKLDWVRPDYVATLRKATAERQRESADFQRFSQRLSQARARRDAKTIPLEQEAAVKLLVETQEPEPIELVDFGKDFINREILNVAVDYLSLLPTEKLQSAR